MIDLGLGRIHRLLANTPLPWRAVHVAGTNGKGSVCAYVTAMLDCYNRSALLKHTRHRPLTHGRFTSPHLIDRWDCITIDGTVVSQHVFEHAEAEIEHYDNLHDINGSEFEKLTATAFALFTRSKVDIGVVEVGMGGRLDSTNILGEGDDREHRPLPLVTAITSIGLDHQQFLGSTLESIAAEKSGIIKASVPVIAATQSTESVDRVVADHASSRHSGCVQFVSPGTSARDVWHSFHPEGKSDFILDTDPVQSRWPNGAVAVHSVWSSLQQLGRLDGAPLTLQADLLQELCTVPSQTVWPGRLQAIDLDAFTGRPTPALLDGAHNIDSVVVLRKHLDGLSLDKPITWVIAVSDGKDIAGMLKILLRPGDMVAAVEFGPVDGMPWVKPMSAEAVAVAVTNASPSTSTRVYGPNIEQALHIEASRASDQGRHIVIAGSLYLVGDFLRKMRRQTMGRGQGQNS